MRNTNSASARNKHRKAEYPSRWVLDAVRRREKRFLQDMQKRKEADRKGGRNRDEKRSRSDN